MSKRIINHPEPPKGGDAVTAWRSVGEKEGSANFRQLLDREFPRGDTLTEEEQGLSRRNFTKLMGASAAMAGLAACRRPEAYIVPFKKAPEWVVPGKPLYYATARPAAAGAIPLVVTTFEGRPTKLEPNNEHPDASGTDAITQASILDLYSPFRSQTILQNGEASDKASLLKALQGLKLSETALLYGADDSPTRSRLAKELAGKGAKLISYEPLVEPGLQVMVDFEKADRVLSLDCDFLGTDSVGNPKAFSARRMGGAADYQTEVDADKMNRLYQVETQFSLTGGMADHRLRVAPSRVAVVASEIARALGVTASLSASEDDKKALFPGAENPAAEFDQWVKSCAADLKQAGSRALVLVGSRHETTLKHLALAMNQKLGSLGTTIKVLAKEGPALKPLTDLIKGLNDGSIKNVISLTPANPVYDADGFAEAYAKATTTFHFGLRTDATAWASTWHIPAAHYLESWGDARTASGTISLIQPLILPLYGGIPELEILHALLGGQFAEGDFSPAMGEVKKTFKSLAKNSDDKAWRIALRDGFVAGTNYQIHNDQRQIAPSALKASAAPSPENLEVVFASDASVWDGRYIDNAWLQESPDPVTKLTWDNAAQISPQTAKDLGLYDEIIAAEPKNSFLGLTDPFKRAAEAPIGEGEHAKAPMITLTVGEREITIPVLLAFGHADNAITIPLGYGQAADDGRKSAVVADSAKPVVGDVGINTGFNAYALRSAETPYFVTGAKATLTGERYKVALTQEHHSMYGRALAREISTMELEGKGDFAKQTAKVKKQGVDSHVPPNISLYDPKGSSVFHDEAAAKNHLSDEIHQWGMAIDLNTCTGCNACLVACQAENNIPVVGKDQVAMGREMHWIRMDRYYAAMEHPVDHGHVNKSEKTPDWVHQNPEMIPQPVACVQCELAPCETVCPVNATVHTEEGLNSMAYNRCIGTRYCANNCPYKARRFNFFDYNKRNPLIKGNLYKGPFGEKQVGTAPSQQRNPNVTVRMRGVMEKCTYCVQRLESAKIKQKQQQKQNTLAAGVKSTEVKVDRANDLRVPTDSVKVACQDACPTNAISFGNLLNNDSQVVRAKGNDMDSIRRLQGDDFKLIKGSGRNYDLLNYINTRPRTSYLARVKNPNPEMPDAKYLGQATINIH